MSVPSFPEFKLIGLEDQPWLREQIARHPSEACEISFANIYIWRHFDHPMLTMIHGNVCLLFEPPDEPAYFVQPVGDDKVVETVMTCLTAAPRLSRLPESFVNNYGSSFRCEPERNHFDYIYRTDDLIDLRGKRYDGKRNRIRKFKRNNAFAYLRLSPPRMEECLVLMEEWFEKKAAGGGLIGAQKATIAEALVHFETLGLVGGAIEIEGKIKAFSLGEKLTADTAVVHVEIASPSFDGLSQLMNREFVRNEWASYPYVNREQDLGIPGLRRAKMSYYPHRMVKKYSLTLS